MTHGIFPAPAAAWRRSTGSSRAMAAKSGPTRWRARARTSISRWGTRKPRLNRGRACLHAHHALRERDFDPRRAQALEDAQVHVRLHVHLPVVRVGDPELQLELQAVG